MLSWCRTCRRWVGDGHFELPDQSPLGCGQAHADVRYHPLHPRCGDVWLTVLGPSLVVGTSPNNEILLRCGRARNRTWVAFAEIGRFVTFLRDPRRFGRLYNAWEDDPYPAADPDGRSVRGEPPDETLADEFLTGVTRRYEARYGREDGRDGEFDRAAG